MMKRTAFLFVAALFAASAYADDRTRDVQAELKKQGFFYGEVNGQVSEEMSAAVRRFQIRNGLKVTGDADDQTVAALGIGGGKPAAPTLPPAGEKSDAWEPVAPKKAPQINPRPVAPEAAEDEEMSPRPPTVRTTPRDLLVREREGKREVFEDSPQPPSDKVLRGVPVEPSFVEPPRSIPNATYDPASAIFRGTPYATAPRELQEDTIAAAQRILQRERVYVGQVDGIAGQMTSEALFNYQEKYALRPTGRLDMDTLARMNLLPRVAPHPGSRPFYNPNQRRDRTVLRGVWVR